MKHNHTLTHFIAIYHRALETALHGTLLLTLLAGSIAFNAGSAHASQVTVDPLVTRAKSELAVFTNWLAKNNVKGYIGEVGWPDNSSGDAASWNSLANYWYSDADAAHLWVTAWATGSWWGTTYPLSIYQDRLSGSGVDSGNAQSGVLEAHNSTASYSRGINVSGGEFGVGGSFGNTNPGTYGTNYSYDSSATFSYLYSRGVRVVRLPFRWERIQPNLNGPLDTSELGRLKDVTSRAGAAGIQVILDLHNYGEYDSNGQRETIGQQVSSDQLANLWSQLSAQFKANPTVVAYDIMNEPHDIGGTSPAVTWQNASQQVLNAIRSNGDSKLIMIPGYSWSSAARWTSSHPFAWISDPASNFRYEAHQYFDNNTSGTYSVSYNSEVTAATRSGYKSSTITTATTVVTTPEKAAATDQAKTQASSKAAVTSIPLPTMAKPNVTSSTAPSPSDTTTIAAAVVPSAVPLGHAFSSPLVLSASKVAMGILIPILILILICLGWLEYYLHHRKIKQVPTKLPDINLGA